MDLENELQVHWSLKDCDGILQLLELFEDDNFAYLILEYQEGGSLLDHVISREKFNETQSKIIME